MSLLREFFAPIKPCGYCKGRGSWWEWEGYTSAAGTSKWRMNNGPWRIDCEACRGTGFTTEGKRAGRRALSLVRGWGFCYRCRTPWCFVTGHSTMYSEDSGCFPLCQRCWSEVSLRRRLRYYRRLRRSWRRASRGNAEWSASLPTWDEIRRGVLAEALAQAEVS